MDRRKFLQSLTAVGISAALPATAFSRDIYPAVVPSASFESNNVDSKFQTLHADTEFPRIGIIAVGGAGGIILSSLAGRLPYLDRSIAVDTNLNALNQVSADHKILVGESKRIVFEPNAARLLAMGVKEKIISAATGLDLVFILAGMGGVTGTGISPMVAETLSEMGILTIGAAVTPFDFEGHKRIQNAHSGLDALSRRVTTLFPISNQTIAVASGENAAVTSILNQSDQLFESLYLNISNTVSEIGLIGIDFEDVKTVLSCGGYSAFGFGAASGPKSQKLATLNAISSPLLGQNRLSSAAGVLVAIEGNRQSLKMSQINTVFNAIKQHVSSKNIMYSARYNDLAEDFRVSILATGLQAG